MRNAGLEEAQLGIETGGRNINNLRYADDTTLMAENEELKSLLMKVKEGLIQGFEQKVCMIWAIFLEDFAMLRIEYKSI